MKTIEERAKELFPINYETDTSEFTFNQTGRQYGYIEGATDQLEIDIQRASKWLKQYIIVFTETPSMLEDFKRAMKE